MIKLKFFLIFTFSLFSFYIIKAQDTTTIQTFTLEMDERVSVFEFPDDANKTYEKIIMTYRMRCHDNAVGNGNVGCREWDYSCNTFITDSTRVDSNRAIHPTHIISNYNEDYFEYSDNPTYSYYQYVQKEVSALSGSQTEAAIGQGGASINIGGDRKSNRLQFLFTAQELTDAGLSAGSIKGFNLDVSSPGEQLSFLRVRLKSTTLSELNSATTENDGFQEVYFLNTDLSTAGSRTIPFYENFNWDGQSNLLVDISYTNQETNLLATLESHETGFTSSAVANNNDYSIEFTGEESIKIDPSALNSINDEITVSFWSDGNKDILPANTTIIEGVDAENKRQVNIHLPWSNGQVYWDCGGNSDGYDRINKTADESSWKGQWNHWAFTKNRNTGSMKIFLNGSLFHSGTGNFKSIDLTAMSVASSITGNSRYYGSVDELQVWDRELSQEILTEWMFKSIDDSHPLYNNLSVYYKLNAGANTNINDSSPNQNDVGFVGAPNWKQIRGRNIFKEFDTSSIRPNITFLQGGANPTVNDIIVVDSVQNNPVQIIEYGLDGTDLIGVDTFFAYRAGFSEVFDEDGNLIDVIDNPGENSIEIGELVYFNKFPSKYEILSLVTPYGNGLSLGADGKQFTFDVTDYAPILKGKKRMSIEMGGQNQEELDIKFHFIEGTPPREVMDIQNIWPFRRGWFPDILNNSVFEPRQLTLDENGDYFKIRSSITGHGQNGEFVSRNHFININEGANEFEYAVWKKCGGIPIYPQGGTWLYDRAGWCPGDPTTVNEFPLTDIAQAGQSISVDYGLLGLNMTEANYLVSNQLVTYGEANFDTDASVIDILRPSKKVEYERFNPACNLPTVRIRNTGSSLLTQLDITYNVRGGQVMTYTWNGSLAMMESEDVELPVVDLGFWNTASDQKVFEVSISNPNGGSDQYPNNNTMTSTFNEFNIYNGSLSLDYRTNNRGSENRMFVTDYKGDIVLERNNLSSNTTYLDQLDLPTGCYTLHFTDSGDDGLTYWADPAAGTGYFRIKQLVNGTIDIPIKTFETEFGSFIQFDFFIDLPVGVEDVSSASWVSVSPNPSADIFNFEVLGFQEKEILVQVFDLKGIKILEQKLENNFGLTKSYFNLDGFANGMYLLQISDGKNVKQEKIIKGNR